MKNIDYYNKWLIRFTGNFKEDVIRAKKCLFEPYVFTEYQKKVCKKAKRDYVDMTDEEIAAEVRKWPF